MNGGIKNIKYGQHNNTAKPNFQCIIDTNQGIIYLQKKIGIQN